MKLVVATGITPTPARSPKPAAGVGIFNPDGERIKFIDTPENPANVGFGGADGRTLYLTARKGLYSVRMNVNASR